MMAALIQQSARLYLDGFSTHLYQIGYSEGTQKMLPALVKEFIQQQGIADISYIEQQHVKRFFEYLQTRPLKKRSGALSEMMISHYAYALRTFFTWLEITEQTDYNPISGIKFKKPRQQPRQPLSVAEIQQLFEAACQPARHGSALKQTALLHVFYSCGLRKSEGEALNINDIHFKQQLLYVREGKGAKRRVVPMTAKVSAALENYYLDERTGNVPLSTRRGVRGEADEEAFFLNTRGSRMRGDTMNKILKALLEKAFGASPAGRLEAVSLHHLRHSIATHLLQSGMSLEYVRDFLGHRFLESTQLYAKVSPLQLKLL